MKKKIMTVDLEPDLRSMNCKSMEVVVPEMLDFFKEHQINATFFTVTSLLDKYEDQIKEIAKKHEVASHSHTHSRLNQRNALWEIQNSKKVLEEYGIACKGFRAPGFMTTKDHFSLLQEGGYSYDASLARFFPGRYQNLSLKGKPFMQQEITEFPMPNFIYPAVNSGLSYLKLLHPLSKGFRKPYMFYLHPWEFLEKRELSGKKSFVGSFLTRNTGKKAWKIFREYVVDEEIQWVSCKDWMEKNV